MATAPTVDVSTFDDTQKQLVQSAASLGTGINTINTSQLAPSGSVQLPEFQREDPNMLRGSITSAPDLMSLYSSIYGDSAAKKEQGSLVSDLTSELRSLSESGAYFDEQGNIVAPQFTAQKEEELGITNLRKDIAQITGEVNALKLNEQNIPLQIQEEFTGRGATVGGAEPIEMSRLRQNAIRTNILVGQGLLKLGMLEAAQVELDKAVQKEFAPKIARIQFLERAYERNKDLLEEESKDKADKLKMFIDERKRILDAQVEDRKVGNALAASAASLFPNDPEAQRAAQQASLLDVESPEYLSNVLKLVGKYQRDPLATAQAVADLEYKNALTLKARREANAALGGGTVADQLYTGLSSATATAVRGKVAKYSSEPIVQNFATIQEGYNFASSLSDKTQNPADDQALIYSLAKALDPGSVVREGEYNTAQRYAQSWVNAYGKGVEQAILGTGFLSEQARRNIKQTIKQKYEASKSSYDNIYTQYSKNINTLTGRADGASFLQDYYIEPTAVARNVDKFSELRSMLSPGEILVIRNGQPYAITPDELDLDTDTLPPDPSLMSLK